MYKTFLLLFGVSVFLGTASVALADASEGRFSSGDAMRFSSGDAMRSRRINPGFGREPQSNGESLIEPSAVEKTDTVAQVTSQVPAAPRQTPAVAAQTASKQSKANSLKEAPTETINLVSDLLNRQSADRAVQSNQKANSPAEGMAQMTSVTQLSDVQPNDWAFQAVQSLVERYGCIEGYPNKTFQGNRATTRYELAAALNACLGQISAQLGNLTPEELATIKRLQDQFAAELAILRGRVDVLEARTAELQANQFSTTTVFGGEVIFGVADAFGGDPPGGCRILDDSPITNPAGGDVNNDPDVDCRNPRRPETNTVLAHLVRLGLETSFTGKDRLRTYLVTGDFDNGGFTNPGSLNTYMSRFSYQAGLDNQVILDLLEYRFPAFNDRVVFSVIPYGYSLSSVLSANSPYFDTGRGSISRFGEASPIFKLGGVLDAGVGFDWLLSDQVRLQATFGTGNDGNPTQSLTAADRNALGVQLLLNPLENLLTGLTYVNAYSKDGSLGTFTGSANAESSGFWSGSAVPGPAGSIPNKNPNAPSGFGGCCGEPLGDLAARTNAIGATLQWRITPKLTLGAWGGLTFTQFLDPLPDFAEIGASAGKKPFANTTTYQFSLGLSDPFGREGDLLAFLVGQPPKLVDAGPETPGVPVPFYEIPRRGEPAIPVTDNNPTQVNGTAQTQVGVKDSGTSLHFEVFYRFKVSDNIYITPGFFIVTNPGHISENNDIFMGTIRTTFRF